jgi:hypothetical protein
MVRTQGGVATSDLVRSARLGNNADQFPDVLRLHVPPGSTVADVTYGEGVFWRNVPPGDYDVLASDLKTGTDCRALPYGDGTLDAVVLDPPYMEGFFRETSRAGSGSHEALSRRYSSGNEAVTGGPKYQDAVLHFYLEATAEAQRALRPGGVLIVKCQDAVSAGRQHLTHVDIVNALRARGMYAKDLFVLVRTGRPSVSRMLRQVHARKSHSYFLVFTKGADR